MGRGAQDWGSRHSCEQLVETLNKGGKIFLNKKIRAGETTQGLGLVAAVETQVCSQHPQWKAHDGLQLQFQGSQTNT